MTTNIGYDVLVSCNEQLVADFASDPGGNAGVMFQNRLISEGTNQKIIQLDKTNTERQDHSTRIAGKSQKFSGKF